MRPVPSAGVTAGGPPRRSTGSQRTPPGRGTDPVEVRSDGLDLVRDNNDVVFFTVAAPQRDGKTFDPAPIVDSFRLED